MDVTSLKGKKVGLAVSGGLDSCTTTRWLADNGVKVICFCADLAQPDEKNIDDIRKRMMACGAEDFILVDAKHEMALAGLHMIQAQAKYEGDYWNTTGIARHVTVAALLPEMRKRGVTILGHGSTGRGNDQVRFQLCTNMLAPDFEVYAPWRDKHFIEKFGGRKEMIEFCQEKKLPITSSLDSPYSTDANILGLTHEAGKLESLQTPAGFIKPGMGVHPKDAPNTPEKFTVQFDGGVPIRINDKPVDIVTAFLTANEVGGRNGVGIGVHMVENRFVGIKSRGVYEAPGMELLGCCYEYVLQCVADRRAMELFKTLSAYISKQVYQGYYFDLGTTMAISGLKELTKLVTGTITVEVFKGNVSFAAASDMPNSLYSEEICSMEKVGTYDHSDSEGFLKVLSVSAKAVAATHQVREDLF